MARLVGWPPSPSGRLASGRPLLALLVSAALVAVAASQLSVSNLRWLACDAKEEGLYAVRLREVTASLNWRSGAGAYVVRVGGRATVTRQVEAPVPTELTIIAALARFSRKSFIVPCVGGIGSCRYEDACAIAANLSLPSAWRCPVAPGEVDVPPMEVPVPSGVPISLLAGSYGVQVNATHGNETVACYQVIFRLV